MVYLFFLLDSSVRVGDIYDFLYARGGFLAFATCFGLDAWVVQEMARVYFLSLF